MPSRSRSSARLLYPYRRREARVDLDQLDVAQRAPEMALRGAAEHLHGRPGVEPAAGSEGDGTGAVQSNVREEPAVRRHPGLLGAPGRADDEGGRLVDRPLARVPQVVREGQRTVARSRPGDLLRREWSRKRRVGVGLGHVVEPGPERGDVVALLLGCHALGGAQRVLDERVLLHDGPDEAGRHLDRCHEVGRARHHLVGLALRLLPARRRCPRCGPRRGPHQPPRPRCRTRPPPRRPRRG